MYDGLLGAGMQGGMSRLQRAPGPQPFLRFLNTKMARERGRGTGQIKDPQRLLLPNHCEYVIFGGKGALQV